MEGCIRRGAPTSTRAAGREKWPEAKILLHLLHQSCDARNTECLQKKATYVVLRGLGGTNERF
jgi:hypothetical protein